MIQRPTAFIFGAGSSFPYGFPTGQGLMQMARSLDLMNLESKIGKGRQPGETEEFRTALSRTHDPSLDALLELRPDITEIGKRLIASLILELEFHSPGRFPKPDEDWLTVFFDELAANTKCLEDFGKNQISLITYNYDRLLEHRLSGALMAHYGRSEQDCIQTLAKIPIIHLHGDLGLLPGFAKEDAVPFGPSPVIPQFRQYIAQASKRIVIVHEAQAETAEFDRARGILQAVRQVVTVGFGFGEKNLARLELDRWDRSRKSVTGTVFGMTNSQIHYSVKKPFEAAGIVFKDADSRFGAREFFANNLHIFREST